MNTDLYERVIGRDPQGHQRVFAPTVYECTQEAVAYVFRRPDTGPLGKWQFVLQRFEGDTLLSEEVL